MNLGNVFSVNRDSLNVSFVIFTSIAGGDLGFFGLVFFCCFLVYGFGSNGLANFRTYLLTNPNSRISVVSKCETNSFIRCLSLKVLVNCYFIIGKPYSFIN